MSNLQHSTLVGLLKEGMAKGTIPFLTVTSNSMSPLLRKGDQVGLRPVGTSELRAGDVLVLQERDGFMTHRFWGTIQEKGQTMLLTRGDRVLHFDRPWAAQQLLGRVVVRRRSQKLLWLDRGRGRRLNGWLARLARWENRIFSGTHSAAPGTQQIPDAPEGVTIADNVPVRKRRSHPLLLLRRTLHGSSWILTQLVDLLPPAEQTFAGITAAARESMYFTSQPESRDDTS